MSLFFEPTWHCQSQSAVISIQKRCAILRTVSLLTTTATHLESSTDVSSLYNFNFVTYSSDSPSSKMGCIISFPEMHTAWQVPIYENMKPIVNFDPTPEEVQKMKDNKVEVPFAERNAKRKGGKELVQLSGGEHEVEYGKFGEVSVDYCDAIEKILRNTWKLCMFFDEMYKDFMRNVYPEKNVRMLDQSVNYISRLFEDFFRLSKYRIDEHVIARKDLSRPGYKDLETIKLRLTDLQKRMKSAENISELEAKMPQSGTKEEEEPICPNIHTLRIKVYTMRRTAENLAKHYDNTFLEKNPEFKIFDKVKTQMEIYKVKLPVPLSVPDSSVLPPPKILEAAFKDSGEKPCERRNTLPEVPEHTEDSHRRNTVSTMTHTVMSKEDQEKMCMKQEGGQQMTVAEAYFHNMLNKMRVRVKEREDQELKKKEEINETLAEDKKEL
uniref:BAR domain-containing protein n=1 Tax=Caenorhabditis tropicalis TaxID=1561998 RepID=A0A1I7TQ23_9PELO